MNAWTQLWPPTIDRADPVPVGEGKHQDADQRDDAERDEDEQGRQHQMPSRLFAAPGGAPASSAWISPGWTRGASAAMSLADDRVHVGRELLGRDRQLEQLGDVVQQRLGRAGLSAWSQDCAKLGAWAVVS